MTRSISVLRPITGSKAHSWAIAVKSVANWSTIGVLLFSFLEPFRRLDEGPFSVVATGLSFSMRFSLAADLFGTDAKLAQDIHSQPFVLACQT